MSQRSWFVPRVDREYVARMGDVLDLFAEVPDPKLVRFGENSFQPIGETPQPVPPKPGQIERYD
jgi:hypothetical protein